MASVAKQVFISYAREDKERVRRLYRRLKKDGIDSWWDEEDLDPGVAWPDRISTAIKNCTIFLACLSTTAVRKRGHVQVEMQQALEVLKTLPAGDVYVIPLCLETCAVPEPIADRQKLDLFAPKGYERLLTALRERLSHPPTCGTEPRPNPPTAPRPFLIGIDVGTTKIAGAIVSVPDGQAPTVVLEQRINHAEIGRETGILDKVESVVRRLIADHGLKPGDIAAVGIGLPGQVDSEDGVLKFAPGLALHEIAVAGELTRRLGIATYADNDVKCATLAELRHGWGRTNKDLVCVFVGTGIGGGIVVDGRLLRGSAWCAGEVGHMKIAIGATAEACTCGGLGCFEAYASSRALIRMARAAIDDAKKNGVTTKLAAVDQATVRPEVIVAAAKAGDDVACAVITEFGRVLAVGLANIANVLNPDVIVLGGGLVKGLATVDGFNKGRDQSFRAHAFRGCADSKIRDPELGDHAPIIGACLLALERSRRRSRVSKPAAAPASQANAT